VFEIYTTSIISIIYLNKILFKNDNKILFFEKNIKKSISEQLEIYSKNSKKIDFFGIDVIIFLWRLNL